MKVKLYFVLACPYTNKHSNFRHKEALGIKSVVVGGSCVITKISLSTPMVTLLGCRTSTTTTGKQIYEITKNNHLQQ